MTSRKMTTLLLIVSLCALTLPVSAQSDRGTVTGSVTDSSGAVVPDGVRRGVAVRPAPRERRIRESVA